MTSTESAFEDSPCRWVANVAKDGWDCTVHGGFGYDPIDLALSCPERVNALKREIERLRKENAGFAYVIHAANCELCNPMNRPSGGCEHGLGLLEEARPGATAGMKVFKYE